MRQTERARPWWRRLGTALAPRPLDIAERLTQHYAAEVRLADGLAQEVESLARYPSARDRVLGAAERARGRAQRIRQALEGLKRPVTEPWTRKERTSSTYWVRLRDSVSELSRMSDACLVDAQAIEREHSGIASLLRDLHRETSRDRRDLIWTLAQLPGTTIATSLEAIPV